MTSSSNSTSSNDPISSERVGDVPFILGVDLDGVCGNYEGAMREFACSVMPERTPESFRPQDRWSFVDTGWFASHEQFLQMHAGSVEAGMFATMDVIEGASKALHTLSEAGIHIRIITHRLLLTGAHRRVVTDTVDFLDKHDLPYRDLCFVADKTTVHCDLLIDDAPHNIVAARAAGNETIIFDQLYNRELAGARALSWAEVVDKVLEARRSDGESRLARDHPKTTAGIAADLIQH